MLPKAMSAATELRTIATAVAIDGDKMKGARFFARATAFDPTHAADHAKAELATTRAAHPDAAHHGFAWRSGPVPADFGWSDGGEPIGTAGKSILQRIDQVSLLNTLVIVSRYPGTQKLSTSDLAKGYGDTARVLLAACTPVAFIATTRLALTFDYVYTGAVQGVLAAFQAVHEGADYATEVQLVVRVASERLPAITAALHDATAGRIRVAPTKPSPA